MYPFRKKAQAIFRDFSRSLWRKRMSMMSMFLSIAWVATLAVAYVVAIRLLKKLELY